MKFMKDFNKCNYSHSSIGPSLQRGNEDGDSLASRTAEAVFKHSHAERSPLYTSAKNTYKSMLLLNGNSIDFIGLLRLMYNDERRA